MFILCPRIFHISRGTGWSLALKQKDYLNLPLRIAVAKALVVEQSGFLWWKPMSGA
jgi:hypothetical protein